MKSSWRWVGGVAAVLLILGAGVYLIFHTEREVLDQGAKDQAPGEFLTLPGGEVHYLLQGPETGPLVVLVHGFSVPSYVWEPTCQALLDAGYQVLVYDMYGRGYSERVEDQYDVELFTTQLGDLLEILEITQPIVLGGLSMGGPITARFAHLHPQQVEAVILVAPEVARTTASDIFPLNLPLVGEYLMAAVMEPFVLPDLQATDFFQAENFPGWEDRYRVQLQYKGTGAALLSTIRNLTEQDPEQEFRALGETGIPVLVIWGEEDQTIGFEQVDLLRNYLGEIEIEIVPGAGHLPHYEQAGIVNLKILNFLAGLNENGAEVGD